MNSDCNANEYCDYSSYACTAKKSNGGTCTSSDACVSGFCDYDDMTMTYACAAKKANGASCMNGDTCESNFCNGNVCSVKKPTNALCMNSDECASDLCESFPIRNGCSPGKCWECYDESTCNAQTGCNYDMMMSYCQQTSSGNCKTRPHAPSTRIASHKLYQV